VLVLLFNATVVIRLIFLDTLLFCPIKNRVDEFSAEFITCNHHNPLERQHFYYISFP
jgi:hypothetical protein